MTQYEQASLFSSPTAADAGGSYRVQPPSMLLDMQPDALDAWKRRVFHYQQRVREQPSPQQGALFELEDSPGAIADHLNPFALPRQNTEFWRWRATDSGVSALYFVIDETLPLLLYVGETVKSNQRWKGEHDCKRYLDNYRMVHYAHQLPTQLNIAFWPDAPTATRPRQHLESALIYRWRSPFNKENWTFWGTPFTGGKS
jgi:hypothetical protein